MCRVQLGEALTDVRICFLKAGVQKVSSEMKDFFFFPILIDLAKKKTIEMIMRGIFDALS